MKFSTTAAVLATAALFGIAGPMSAQAVEFDVGPGGVRIERGHHYRAYDRSDCRLIITHRTNRFGDDVTVRRRVCD